ncbi:peptidoglycan DD-metalloendopeptidase family protein [Salinimicrobium sp. GXAS 041]|uniref:peptidoglycan DD-metalloendopeptidase family protein n=1 Tax=Salinimicrobium sp. GXAS 041 TaxID=3400806 RepID=UPI003C7145AC
MHSSGFSDYLSSLTTDFTPVLDIKYKAEDYVSIDLSKTSDELVKTDISSSEDFSEYMEEFLQKRGAKAAFGGYNETRDLYRRSVLFTASPEKDLNRNIHLGVDLWAPHGTAVLAVLDGKVHSFQDNKAFGDYGPTIILEHAVENQTFYSLYGHLSRRSLDELVVGQIFKKGEKIAELGEPLENGDYAPHLHFQLIKDLQGRSGDYPGVACRREIESYLKNCPNPNLLLKFSS